MEEYKKEEAKNDKNFQPSQKGETLHGNQIVVLFLNDQINKTSPQPNKKFHPLITKEKQTIPYGEEVE